MLKNYTEYIRTLALLGCAVKLHKYIEIKNQVRKPGKAVH